MAKKAYQEKELLLFIWAMCVLGGLWSKLGNSVNKLLAKSLHFLLLTTPSLPAGSRAPVQSIPKKANSTCLFGAATTPSLQTKKKKEKKKTLWKIQLSFSWKHLISLWKFKLYVNQLSAWPSARSRGAAHYIAFKLSAWENSAATTNKSRKRLRCIF